MLSSSSRLYRIVHNKLARIGIVFLVTLLLIVSYFLPYGDKGAHSRGGRADSSIEDDAGKTGINAKITPEVIELKITKLKDISNLDSRFAAYIKIRNEINNDLTLLSLLWQCAPELFEGEKLKSARLAVSSAVVRLDPLTALNLILPLPPGVVRTKIITETFACGNILKLAELSDVLNRFEFPEDKTAFYSGVATALQNASSEEAIKLLSGGGFPWSKRVNYIESHIARSLRHEIYDNSSYVTMCGKLSLLPVDSATRVRGEILGLISNNNPQLALTIFQSDLSFSGKNDAISTARTQVIGGVVYGLMRESPSKAGKMVLSLPLEMRLEAVKMLSSRWLVEDSIAATDWINSNISDALTKRAAVTEVIAYLQGIGDSESAAEWRRQLEN